MKFLVSGCGSIGKRHIKNLRSLGYADILAFDVRKERLEEAETIGATAYSDLGEALMQDVDAVLVCSPPIFHTGTALKALQSGCHVFIEKPISNVLEDLDYVISTAQERQLVTMVGFNLRFDKGLRIVRKLLDEGVAGKIATAVSVVGQYLPDQHPWEDYRHGYAASNSLGGGIVLDGMHELDLLSWFLGDVKEICCFGGKLSSLEMDAEDTAAYLLRFANNSIGVIEMDYVKRVYERTCELIGEKGTIRWDFVKHAVKLFSADKKDWVPFSYDQGYDINNMYIDEMQCFINCILGKESPPVDAIGGKKLLKIAIAAKESIQRKRVMRL